ncbi:MAG: twin-arginine translocase TatA/TatE family subunit [Verrucomicrobiota bacterium]|nr:twin-arginine translocase TatA/TatE family subunit [Verrucomicrobiota bacterium]MEC8333121.1 twin-arginine translocase TatA/TatE family subunit [Verrucomicrobiota bacterium]MEC9228313.1 twin-arginine translocase TatA/TatE family subunit [Verrucomicrobiota bacterium]
MYTSAFLQNINGPEILLIFLIVLLLFGAKRLPDLFKSFGKSIREFKKATSEIEDDFRAAMDEEPTDRQSTPVQSTGQSEPTQVASEPVVNNSIELSQDKNSSKQ